LVKGASKGEGLGNKFLSHVREVDALVHVVRLFQDPDVVNTMGTIDPVRDIEIIETELLLADLESVQKQIESIRGAAKSGDKTARERLAMLEPIKQSIEQGTPVRNLNVPVDVLKTLFLLTSKPILYVGNVGEKEVQNDLVGTIEAYAKKQRAEALMLSVKVESEIAQLDEAERESFRVEMGIEETGLQKLIRKSFSLLDVITFFTVGPDEVKAWTIPAGTFAPQAAGKIHSDIERGFIRAEVYSYGDIDRYGAEAILREKGLIRMEGKTYPMKDGDVVFFRFAV
jgi:hypothetical protein